MSRLNRTALSCIILISSLILGCNTSIEDDNENQENQSQVEEILQEALIPQGEDTLLFFTYVENDFGINAFAHVGTDKHITFVERLAA